MMRRHRRRSAPRRVPLTTWRKLALVVGGTLVGLLLAEGGLRAGGAAYRARQRAANQRALDDGGEYRILCVGESTTAMGGDYAYPAQLERILDAMDLGVDVAVLNEGVPGTTSGRISATFLDMLHRYRPQMAVAMMGINDPLDDDGTCDPTAVRSWFRDLRLYKALSRPWPLVWRKSLPKDGAVEMIAAEENAADAVSARARERELRRALRADPDDAAAVAELAGLLARRGELAEADALLDDALVRHADDATLLVARADMAWASGDGRGARAWFERALAVEPGHADASLELGRIARREGQQGRARELLEAGHARHPDDSHLAGELAGLLQDAGDTAAALAVLDTTMATGSDDPYLYVTAADMRCGAGDFDEAERIAAAAREVAPHDPSVHMRLSACYERAGALRRARTHVEALVDLEPERSGMLRELAELRQRLGDRAGADEALARASELEAGQCPSATRESYQAILDFCRLYGVELVAVQYPRRNVVQLQRMFDADQDVRVVDNQRRFEDAVARRGYDDLFIDRFAGDFGHATPRGNRLLAEGVAEAIADRVRADVVAGTER